MPHNNICADIDPKSGARCTKKPGHFPRTKHSNEKPGHTHVWPDQLPVPPSTRANPPPSGDTQKGTT